MSERPILNDTDFNFSEITNCRLENVSSLPSGLGNNDVSKFEDVRKSLFLDGMHGVENLIETT